MVRVGGVEELEVLEDIDICTGQEGGSSAMYLEPKGYGFVSGFGSRSLVLWAPLKFENQILAVGNILHFSVWSLVLGRLPLVFGPWSLGRRSNLRIKIWLPETFSISPCGLWSLVVCLWSLVLGLWGASQI